VNYHPGDPIPDICSCNAMCNTNVTEVLSGLASGASTNYTCGGTENFTTSNITVNWAGLSESSCGDFGGSWICVPKLSSVNLVIYLTHALKLNITIIKMKRTVHIPTQNLAGMKSQSLSL
jgi:hypothetical protein